ncbi:MAG: chemotaxis protein CheA [Spirochaetota bacterium]
MTPLLEQFISESRDSLQGIGEKLMQLEYSPDDSGIMNELFRLVHTLKGNSGLFDFPEMTKVLHAAEDLMSAVRAVAIRYSRDLADHLMDAMDFVGILCDEIEATEGIVASRGEDAHMLAAVLRARLPVSGKPAENAAINASAAVSGSANSESLSQEAFKYTLIPEDARRDALRLIGTGGAVFWVEYRPVDDCFFHGQDPLFTVLQVPGKLWGRILPPDSWPPLAELDAYRSVLAFQLLSSATREAVIEHFRYVIDQVRILELKASDLGIPGVEAQRSAPMPVREPVRLAEGEDACLALTTILELQRRILLLNDDPAWGPGRRESVAIALTNCLEAVGETETRAGMGKASISSLKTASSQALLEMIDGYLGCQSPEGKKSKDSKADSGLLSRASTLQGESRSAGMASPNASASVLAGGAGQQGPVNQPLPASAAVSEAPKPDEAAPPLAQAAPDDSRKFGRRADDSSAPSKSLKVDQVKVDRLMNLIGEMIVSKNALPYLALRAENQYGARELSREIKSQYAVINRIAEEMQDAIMQVRMMPASFVFQRFPRMVREISHKLEKDIQLVLEGEDTEVDKNIIESLADPLVHIVRNSLDHGIELPATRLAAGKPAQGKLILRASQEADRVVIEVVDDGKGIDPEVMKRKAYEKGFIDEVALERMSDREAINLVFAAGLSTVSVISDLSGRGVGMDVVRNAVEKCNGNIDLRSEVGKGTSIRISLPLSMAVTRVMIIESEGQLFGIPMDHVVETVRIPKASIRSIKRNRTTILRDRVVPLKALNALLGIQAEPRTNAEGEYAVLVAKLGNEVLGLLVDDFRETIDVIQKPLDGILSKIAAYSGSAIIGDGSVLMVLNIKEIV